MNVYAGEHIFYVSQTRYRWNNVDESIIGEILVDGSNVTQFARGPCYISQSEKKIQIKDACEKYLKIFF